MQANNVPVTVHVGAPDMIRIVNAKGLSACIADVAGCIERDFLRWRHFDKSARVACHSDSGVIELMPIADANDFAFKYVNGHPNNPREGLPTVMAFGVPADVHTGAPRLLCELTIVTAIRTAAMSAVAARRLARPGCRSMALIGNGAQTEFEAIAFRDLVGIQALRLFDIDTDASAKLAAILADQGLRCASAAARPKQCVAPTSSPRRRPTRTAPPSSRPK